MYRPNPLKRSTFRQWMEEAHQKINDPNQVMLAMQWIRQHHPGVLFSEWWFRAQYAKFLKNNVISLGVSHG